MTSENSISKIPRERLADRVASELRRLVVQGVFPPGSRLPSEMVLAERLGVTRLTLREALVQLESAGLTRTRHGAGTFVVDPAQNATLQTLAETLTAGRDMTPSEIAALLQFRSVVIGGFVEEISRAAPDRIAALQAIVVEERAALSQTAQLATLDFRFNEALALASGNLFYTLLLRSLRQAHEHLGAIVFSQCGDGSVVVDTHAAIVRALERGDFAALKRRIRTYLDGGERIVAQWLKVQK
jgi:GntR family transcriptional repressor for pyruvate dehydrogenase complex